MNSRYQRNICQIVHKYHQMVHKFTDGRTKRTEKQEQSFEQQNKREGSSGRRRNGDGGAREGTPAWDAHDRAEAAAAAWVRRSRATGHRGGAARAARE